MSAISTCLRKYATFSGRATRHEFWMFYLFMNIVLYVPLLIGLSLLTDDSTAGAGIFFIVISIILTIGLVIPHLAVCVRRLHDIGQSGSYLLMSLIPFAGPHHVGGIRQG